MAEPFFPQQAASILKKMIITNKLINKTSQWIGVVCLTVSLHGGVLLVGQGVQVLQVPAVAILAYR